MKNQKILMPILEDSNEGIRWNPAKDRPENYLLVEYSYKSKSPTEAAFLLARDQSVSTYNRLHGETKNLREKRSAKLYSISKKRFTLAYPIANIQGQMGELMVTINGNGNWFHHKVFEQLRVEEIHFPPRFLKRFEGPRIGKTILDYFNTKKRPVIIAVQKPSIGLSPAKQVKRAMEALDGGCEIVKDDEQLYPDDPTNPLEKRLLALRKKIPTLQRNTGKHFRYLFNIQTETRAIEYCKKIEQHQTKPKPTFAIMVSPLLGIPFIHYLRTQTKLPIFSHPSGLGIYTRGRFGYSNPTIVKLLRLAGVDCIIHHGVYSTIAECSPATALAVKKACDQKMSPIKPSALAFGGGMRKENYHQTQKLMQGNDYIFLVGGGIFGNPKGPKKGAEELIQYMEKNC